MRKNYCGLSGAGSAYFLLRKSAGSAPMLACVSEDEIDDFTANLRALKNILPEPSGAPEVLKFAHDDPYGKIVSLKKLFSSEKYILVCTRQSLAEKTFLAASLNTATLDIELGKYYDFSELLAKLVKMGYSNSEFVEEMGQFARRGEIIDIWAVNEEFPFRLVFNGKLLESFKSFDIVTQRSSLFLQKQLILPAKEEHEAALWQHLPENAVMYFDEEPPTEIADNFSSYEVIVNNPVGKTDACNDAGFRSMARWGGNFKLFLAELEKFTKNAYRCVVFSSNQGEKERLEDLFAEFKIHENLPEIAIGSLYGGFYSNPCKLAVFSAQEILYKKKPLTFPKFKSGRRLEGLWEISKNDFVVHEKYGIGRYLGLKKISHGEQESEYLAIEYRKGDKLYVPPDDFRVVQKYIGIEGHRPKLYSLDTGLWEKVKARAKKGAEDMADELLKLYAARQAAPGFAFNRESIWDRELADSFSYEETEDQQKAIEAISRDLEASRPMERVICGDVGFGKTEVAVRAAFKAAVNSKQVAILVPTTVLAEQHYNTISNRLSPFPVKVAMLSRFQAKNEQRSVIAAVKGGTVDIVVGTHRLLQKDISFKDLGLLIIDEEHRFGVKQKEKIKSIKKNVDILYMSATPIPRTMSQALSSLKDLSLIETPPYGRLPIETHLGPYDEKNIKKIISAELSRNGQVFYVHNRVETIAAACDKIARLVPGARIAFVHGKMGSADIEKKMWKFMHKELDVLVATTIIESGLDIPAANTIIIEEAENFGLAQLYQLRGRVGREKKKAYCYLFYSPKDMTDEAVKRLSALSEFGELGSGFRLALRDLEIRGAGNILGQEQHGFVKEIGFDLYSRLLEEASKKLKGTIQAPAEEESKIVMEFLLPAFLPESYISNEEIRVSFYRKLALVDDEPQIMKIREELADRFGKLPQETVNLLELASVKISAKKIGISKVEEDETGYAMYFSEVPFAPSKISELVADFSGRMEFIRGEKQGIRVLKIGAQTENLQNLKTFISAMFKYC